MNNKTEADPVFELEQFQTLPSEPFLEWEEAMARKNLIDIRKAASRNSVSNLVSVEELCNILGITDRRVQQLTKEGLPKERNGKYPLVESVRWYINYLRGRNGEQAESVMSDRQRLLKAQSEKIEIENKKLAGSLLDQGEVEYVLMESFSILKAELMGLPGRLSMEMVGKSAGQIKANLDQELRRVLNDAFTKLKWTATDEFDSDHAKSTSETELPEMGRGETQAGD